MMLLKVAWRNVWRHKVRSFVVITAVGLGLWAGVFASAFVQGMMSQKIDNVIRHELSHLQVHHPEFRDEQLPKQLIDNGEEILEHLSSDPDVTAATGRIITMAMLGSANTSGAVKVSGIMLQEEKKVTELDRKVIEGEFIDGNKRTPILISRKLAEKYKVKLKSKVVLTLQDMNGEITAGAFRITGIFKTENSVYDEMNVFVRAEDLRSLMGIETGFHEIAALVRSHNLADPVAAAYQNRYPQMEVKSWLDLAAGMRFMVEAFDTYLYIIVSIILLALLFSIVNTMLMAVLERTREIGMLMAVGMNKPSVFYMILLETIFLSMIGGPAGLMFSWICVSYFGRVGIDLTGAAYSDVGFSAVIYPQLASDQYLMVTVLVLVMALLAAIYPARKALKLKPVEAIRKI
jgi:putative ABC transport system permease protein